MHISSTNKTTILVRSIILMKNEELLQYKKKIKNLELELEENYNLINLYRYRQANQRFHNLKATVLDLMQLEISLNKKKNEKILGTIF